MRAPEIIKIRDTLKRSKLRSKWFLVENNKMTMKAVEMRNNFVQQK